MDFEQQLLSDYLATVEGYLRTLPAWERIRGLRTLQDAMETQQHTGKTAEEIVIGLGDPRLQALRQIAAVAGLAGAGWVLVLPALLLLALTLVFCGVFVPAAGLYQWIMSLQGQASAGVGIALDGQMLPPGPALAVSLPAGALLLLAAGGCWRGALACVAGLCRRQKAVLAEGKP